MTILNLIDLLLLVCIALAVVLVARHVRRVVNASDGLGEVNDRDEDEVATGCDDDAGGVIVNELGHDPEE